jgi:tRNA(Ile2)-agmatinylcytidine synthase
VVRVSNPPVEFRGGHVKFELQVSGKYIDCMAFEPTKKLRDATRKLIVGDLLYVHGAISSNEFGKYLSLEYMYLVDPVDKIKEIPPICDNCNSRMTSAGKLSGFKCRTCSRRSHKAIREIIDRKLFVGQRIYASHSAQRHLTRPLVRLHKRNDFNSKELIISDFTNF